MNQLNLQLACEKLNAGKVIAYPTEAVWGLGCDPNNSAAVTRLLRLKKRPPAKGLILVAATIEQLGSLLNSLDEQQLAQLASTWPGPITWLIPDPDNIIPNWIKGSHRSVAIRVSDHPLVQQLCTEFGGPIVSTSANRDGQPEIRSRVILEQQFALSIDYIVPGELGSGTKTSEIRDLLSGEVIR
ncbi:MAG: Sua5/YciO/YrdC/YwlC family protein [Proteobacteria bacterium]|nr:Sua5/YciO/YrdC/YwlC family protein [Pseudomonadota bacterium]